MAYEMVGLLLDQITEHAPSSARNADGTPVLDLILRHRYSPGEMHGAVLPGLSRHGIPTPPLPDFKAYLARTAQTGDLAQQLLTLRQPRQPGTASSLVYTLLLMNVGSDQQQFDNVLQYLLTLS
ncbi:hypothetical protein ACFXBB_37860 [Streptomyces scopuliridis]|uniref:hypothetical protein n=1 Tax=Streptomyces scopuliridis TaxID=452529 RepID=UPI0036B822F4